MIAGFLFVYVFSAMFAWRNLNRGTEYSIRDQAQTGNETGPSTQWLQAQILPHDLDETTVPGQPSSLKVKALSNAIMISWAPPQDQGVMIRGYVVGHGVGVPDAFIQILDAKQRYHTIEGLQPSSNYLITLKAYNGAGEGPPVYESAVTSEEPVNEPSLPITPPVGLRATVLSSSAIVLTWTDSNLCQNQSVNDDGLYTVRYSPRHQQSLNSYQMFMNSTNLKVHIEDLEPDTEYEFSVRIIKGKRQSAYSLSVFNRTMEAFPATAPRDVTPVSVENRPTWVNLSWQPPEQSNGEITDLNRGTEYSIRDQAQTRNETGPSTQSLQAQTLTPDLDETTVPGQPSSLRVKALSNAIMISWTPPQDQGVMIRGYVVGHGVGVPDAFIQLLDAEQRHYTIEGLQPSSDYLITLKAYNGAGEGPPVYESAVTREEPVNESSIPITPPVGLRAIVLSSSNIVLTWTDSDIGQSQRVSSNRFYTVRYSPRHQESSKSRQKFINSTNLNVHIEGLKPDTEYEFSVRITKGKRQSAYSRSVFNRTMEASPATAPRDVTPVSVENRPTWVNLSWQPPEQSNGQITGYLVFYTTDSSLSDKDWVLVSVIRRNKLFTMIKNLSLETTYYFKVQARNRVGYGPISSSVIFRTPSNDGM